MANTQSGIQSAEDFQLRNVKIYSDRFPNKFIDITQLVAEINIFEQLNTLYLTGNITFLDDQNVFNIIDIQGTEIVEIELKLPDKEVSTISKRFVILNTQKTIKMNDHSTIINLSLREARGYYNDLLKFSKAYDGSGESIIQKIIEDKLKSNIYNFDWKTSGPIQFNRSYQKLFRYIVPYITPMDAIKKVLSKMTTKYGLPYFCSAALLTDDFLLTDLESILASDSFNSTPFTYSQDLTQAPNIGAQAFSIQKIKSNTSEDTLLAAQLGSIGLSYSITELKTGKSTDTHLSMRDIFDRYLELGILNRTDQYFIDNLFQPKKLIEGSITDSFADSLTDYDSRRFYQISANTYEEDVFNFTEETDIADYFLRAVSAALKRHLLNNTHTITLPGLLFLNPNAVNTSVGYKINLKTFKTNRSDGPDMKRSGDFIILAKRHIFNCSSFKHKVILDVGRISKPQDQN